MPIISLVNQKGGVSKSTTSVHLAYWLVVKQKKTVLLVDADSQRSSSQWVEGMEGVTIPCEVIQTPDDLLEKIPNLTGYDYVIIDGPARAIALLSQIQEAKLLKTVIHQKQAIADTSGQSATVWDLPGKPATESAREYERLFKEVLSCL